MARHDVLVVGAGLAGLSCARDLAQAGADVLVLEARDRPGGRVEQAVLADGRIAQMGGELVGPVHHAYLGLCAELGLPLVATYVAEEGETAYDLVDRVELGEGWLTAGDGESLERAEEAILAIARELDPADPWAHPDAARLDRLSVAALLVGLGVTPTAFRVIEMTSVGSAAGQLHRSSVLAMARYAAAGDGSLFTDADAWESLKVEGGSARLPLALAAGLGDRLRLGAVVRRMAVGAPCVVELADGERLEADAIVCCLPAGPLRDVVVEGVSDARLASLHALRHYHASKAVTALPEPVWRRIGWNGVSLSERDIGGFWVQGESTLSSLFGPEHGGYLRAAPPGTATAGVRAALERICGPVEPVEIAWRHWGDDPFTQGYVGHWALGDVMAVGPLHGTHEPPFYVAGSDHWAAGNMEGAVATGRAAAAAVLGRERPLYGPGRA